MIDKEFVPYTEALTLKEIGFDERCFAIYYIDKQLHMNATYQNHLAFRGWVAAPTFSQAFRWFRDKRYITTIMSDAENVNHPYMFDVFYDIQFMFESSYEFEAYEEAELACLKKLIQIVKSQSHE